MTDQTTSRPSDIIGARIGAALLDIVVLGLLFVVIGVVSGGGDSSDGTLSVHTGTGGTLVFLVLAFAYYFLTESKTGATPGKRLLGLRVVSSDGSAPTSSQIAKRTAMRIVDVLPVLYLVGLLTMLGTGPRAKRLGDLVADTSVVRVAAG